MITEEKIAELETNCKAMTEEIERLKAELVKKNETVWIPEYYNLYMFINSQGEVTNTYVTKNDTLDKIRINFNNVYHSNNTTREHLKWYANNVLRVLNKLMQLHELLCPDYFPDWNIDERKWYVYYNNENKRFECISCYIHNFVVYFTEEAAEKACEILNRENFMMDKV